MWIEWTIATRFLREGKAQSTLILVGIAVGVAVIGASRNPEKVGYAFMHNLTRLGFQGTIVPVNLEAPDILGVKCYKSLEEFPGQIDLSVIVVGGKYVKESVQNSIKAGAKTIIVITAGFKEVNEKGAEAEKELVEICQAAGVRRPVQQLLIEFGHPRGVGATSDACVELLAGVEERRGLSDGESAAADPIHPSGQARRVGLTPKGVQIHAAHDGAQPFR